MLEAVASDRQERHSESRASTRRHIQKKRSMRALLDALFVAVLSLVASTQAAEREALLVAQTKTMQIDINRAKVEELMTLKGIGEARAAAIIKGRPYARKDELAQKRILRESVYNDIKDRIIAKQ